MRSSFGVCISARVDLNSWRQRKQVSDQPLEHSFFLKRNIATQSKMQIQLLDPQKRKPHVPPPAGQSGNRQVSRSSITLRRDYQHNTLTSSVREHTKNHRATLAKEMEL